MYALDEPLTLADDLRDELAQLLAEGAGDDCAWYPNVQAVFEEDLYSEELTALSIAELSMAAAGVQVRFGSGVAAAQTVYAEPVARAVQRLHAAE